MKYNLQKGTIMKKEYYDLYDIVIKDINADGYFVYSNKAKKFIIEKTNMTVDQQKRAFQFFELMGYFNQHDKFPKIYIRSKKLKGGC